MNIYIKTYIGNMEIYHLKIKCEKFDTQINLLDLERLFFYRLGIQSYLAV